MKIRMSNLLRLVIVVTANKMMKKKKRRLFGYL